MRALFAQHLEPRRDRASGIGGTNAHFANGLRERDGQLQVATLEGAEIGCMGNAVLDHVEVRFERSAFTIEEIEGDIALFVIGHIERGAHQKAIAHIERALERDLDAVMDEAFAQLLEHFALERTAANIEAIAPAEGIHLKAVDTKRLRLPLRRDRAEFEHPTLHIEPWEHYHEKPQGR